MELPDVVGAHPKLRFGLHQHTPGAAESVEVVHVQPAEECLQGRIHVGHWDTKRLRFVGVQVDAKLRDRRAQAGVDRGDLRSLPRRLDKCLRHVGQSRQLAIGSILEHQLEPASGAQSEDWRQSESEYDAALQLRELRLHLVQDRLLIEMHGRTLVPRFQQGDDRRDVRVDGIRQTIEAAERRYRFDARIGTQDVLYLAADPIGPYDRGPVWQPDAVDGTPMMFSRTEC